MPIVVSVFFRKSLWTIGRFVRCDSSTPYGAGTVMTTVLASLAFAPVTKYAK